MGLFSKLKKLKVGKLLKQGASLALSQVPGGGLAEKVVNLKNAAGDRKREMALGKAKLKAASAQSKSDLTKLGASMRKGPLVPTKAPAPARPGVLSINPIQTNRLGTNVASLLKDTSLQSSAASKARASSAVKSSRALEAKTKKLTKSDWEALAEEYKASGSKLKWEAWVKQAI